ncbi:hypothetical protein AN644_05285 [Candidatus Epulonipiscium fishelsonii]|nr:hypothetical protein AN644_05285 [Epulopiscium sp. SCG-C06WGA-EpuloA1]
MDRLNTEIQKRYNSFLSGNKPYTIVRIKISLAKLYLGYDCKFEHDQTREVDNTGYIFYKAFGKSYGTLYMFRGKQYVKPRKPPTFNPISKIREFIRFRSYYKNRDIIELKILKAFIIDLGVPLLIALTIFLAIVHYL